MNLCVCKFPFGQQGLTKAKQSAHHKRDRTEPASDPGFKSWGLVFFQKKSYKRDIMKGFSADATIFLFCPWKREKNALKRWSYLAPFFFSKLPWAAHRAKNWKSLSEIGLRHPLLYLLCGAHSLLVKWWFYIFFLLSLTPFSSWWSHQVLLLSPT